MVDLADARRLVDVEPDPVRSLMRSRVRPSAWTNTKGSGARKWLA
jgi:hypothetical protein